MNSHQTHTALRRIAQELLDIRLESESLSLGERMSLEDAIVAVREVAPEIDDPRQTMLANVDEWRIGL